MALLASISCLSLFWPLVLQKHLCWCSVHVRVCEFMLIGDCAVTYLLAALAGEGYRRSSKSTDMHAPMDTHIFCLLW